MVKAVVTTSNTFVTSSTDRKLRREFLSVPRMDDPLLHSRAPLHYREYLHDLPRIALFADRDRMRPGWLPLSDIDSWEWHYRWVGDESELSLTWRDWYNENRRSTRWNDIKWQSYMLSLSQNMEVLGMSLRTAPYNVESWCTQSAAEGRFWERL